MRDEEFEDEENESYDNHWTSNSVWDNLRIKGSVVNVSNPRYEYCKQSEFSDFLYYHPFGSLITFGLAGRPAFFSRDFLDL